MEIQKILYSVLCIIMIWLLIKPNRKKKVKKNKGEDRNDRSKNNKF